MPYYNPHNYSLEKAIANWPINLSAGYSSFIGQLLSTNFPMTVSAGNYAFIGQDTASDFVITLSTE